MYSLWASQPQPQPQKSCSFFPPPFLSLVPKYIMSCKSLHFKWWSQNIFSGFLCRIFVNSWWFSSKNHFSKRRNIEIIFFLNWGTMKQWFRFIWMRMIGYCDFFQKVHVSLDSCALMSTSTYTKQNQTVWNQKCLFCITSKN